MLKQPWFNFGLTIGDDVAGTVTMPKAFFLSLDRAFWDRFERSDWELTKAQQQRAWKMLGHTGKAPTIQLAVRFSAVEDALDEVMRKRRR